MKDILSGERPSNWKGECKKAEEEAAELEEAAKVEEGAELEGAAEMEEAAELEGAGVERRDALCGKLDWVIP